MDYTKHIADAVDYIEDNLNNDICIADCAKACGYSVYHFIRVFKEVIGLTPSDYIRKRRLSEIAKEIAGNNEYISEIAFRYGFNSKENFLRAFKNEHGILPTEYKSIENSLQLYDRFTFHENNFFIAPRIVKTEPFCLTVYKSDESHIPNFWNKYNAKGYSLKLSGGIITRDYGVSIWNFTENKLDYYIGIKSDYAMGDLSGTAKINISGGLYAIFSTPAANHNDFIKIIHSTWDYINNVWLKNSEYRRTGDYEFECYIEKSRLFSEDIFIPIKTKEDLS